jgi:peptide/nickel transport system permease protein
LSDRAGPFPHAIAPALPDLVPAPRPGGAFRAFARRHPAALVGGILLTVIALLAIFAPWLGTVDPTSLSPVRRNRPPSAQHWFGTDMLGRDLYSRVLYGARISLLVGIAVAFLSAIIGTVIGLASGAVRWLDGVIMRTMDGIMSIPGILLAIALMALTRGSVGNVIIAITIVEIPRVARLVRGLVLSLREQPFVEAAVASGSSLPKIVVRHILPNTVAPLLVQATYICAAAMIIESILSFIGAGTPPIIPSWGNIMSEGRALWQIYPHMVFIPAAFLCITVLSVNMLGDGLRDALDPHAVKRF